jgi:hypothetical protein
MTGLTRRNTRQVLVAMIYSINIVGEEEQRRRLVETKRLRLITSSNLFR